MSAFGFHSTAEEVTAGHDLTGQTWLITGVSSGLGRESARVLALRGASIVGLARTEAKAAAALSELGVEGAAVACELSDLSSVRAAVDKVRDVELDGIMANAGIMALRELSQVQGVERQLFVNHLGHFALATGLLDRLRPGGRVVVLSSEAHRMAAERGLELDNASGEQDYHAWRMYGRSKLANILFARALARRFAAEGQGRRAYSLHPGVIQTRLARHVPDPEAMFARLRKIEKTVPQGAATQCLLAVADDPGAPSGSYFSDCAPMEPIEAAVDAELAERLWSWSEAQVG